MKKFVILLSVFSTCSYAQSLDCFGFLTKSPYVKEKKIVDISGLNCTDAKVIEKAINHIVYFTGSMPEANFPVSNLNQKLFSLQNMHELRAVKNTKYFYSRRIFDVEIVSNNEIHFSAYYFQAGTGGVTDRYRFILHDGAWAYAGQAWKQAKFYKLQDVKGLPQRQSPNDNVPFTLKANFD